MGDKVRLWRLIHGPTCIKKITSTSGVAGQLEKLHHSVCFDVSANIWTLERGIRVGDGEIGRVMAQERVQEESRISEELWERSVQ